MKKVMTVCMVREGDRFLLGWKKRGFAAGRWNGFGGKVQEGESIEAGAARELLEEAGISPKRLEHCGTITFSFTDHPDVHEVHYFRVVGFTGAPSESDEMRPQWFNLDDIPYDQMWPDVRDWMPLYLRGVKFAGTMRYDGVDTIIERDLHEQP